MTASGESMERMKERLLLGGLPERCWREYRRRNLARMIAWHRRTRSPFAKAIIVEDIIPDVGWGSVGRLKPMVREEMERLL